MNYKFNCDDWGAKFSLPASVVFDYLKLSDGDFVKVLLCIFAGFRCTTTEELAERAGVSVSVVDDAVIHWQNLGVISLGDSLPEQTVRTTVTQTAPKVQPVSVVEAVKPNEKKVDSKIVVNYSSAEIREKAEKDENLKHLVNDIQSSLQFSINAKELGRLVELYEFYHFDVPTILLTAEYCASVGKRSIAYLYAVMVRWYEEEIVSYADVERKIIKCTQQKSFESKVLRIFGVESRPSKQQREYINHWNDMGFNIELVDIAYNKCMDNAKKLNYKYINTVLESWADKGISTVEQVNVADAQFKKNYDKKKTEEKKETSYDLDEFEEFAMNLNLSGNKS